jgi:hypothetical protein
VVGVDRNFLVGVLGVSAVNALSPI